MAALQVKERFFAKGCREEVDDARSPQERNSERIDVQQLVFPVTRIKFAKIVSRTSEVPCKSTSDQLTCSHFPDAQMIDVLFLQIPRAKRRTCGSSGDLHTGSRAVLRRGAHVGRDVFAQQTDSR